MTSDDDDYLYDNVYDDDFDCDPYCTICGSEPADDDVEIYE